ncbi:rho GTPase-activating protein gacU [Drosophila eugracilis]|uniref:rho GTPase-activating protein gacU n=1 Tax=Drosophila eugracilis TaxID=29029 RepID=UPI001BD9683A|nr:rho GTPase-activating protein gacU [Drosophila eugracilis]
MSWNKRNTSHISIYNYPEHLNPFYEDDNHKRLRFFGFSKKKNENGRHSLSIGNLQELWKSYSFRKKKSSTLGINKTSESPPTLRRDLNDNSYLNSRIFRGDRHTSLQNIDSRRESDSISNGIFFNRNDRYRSTTQFSGYSSPNQNIRSSQTSLASSNPFESQPDSCPSSPMSSRRYRKKRRAPPPPKLVVQDYLATKDIESLASEIDEFVNNRKESLIKQEFGEEVPKSSQPKISVTAPISDIEPSHPSTSKAPPSIDVKQSKGISTIIENENVTILNSDTKINTRTSPTPQCIDTVHIKQSNAPEIPNTSFDEPKDTLPNTASPLKACTPKTPECIASVHIKQSSENVVVRSEEKPNNSFCDQLDETKLKKKPNGFVPVIIKEESVVINGDSKKSEPPVYTEIVKQSEILIDSGNTVIPSTSKRNLSIANDSLKLSNESENLKDDLEPSDSTNVEDRKTNSFGTVKQISQIFEENISSSGSSNLPKKNTEVLNLNGAISKNVVVVTETSDVLQIREDFELANDLRFSERQSNDRFRSSLSAERESNSTPTPRMRKKKSIKEVLESISRNQKILNESAAKGTKVYLTPSYAENKYNYPNELNNVNNRSSKEVTSTNISVSTSDTNELPSQNLFINKISKFKGQFRESSPTSSNLDWNPLPKPSRSHNSASSSFNNGSC